MKRSQNKNQDRSRKLPQLALGVLCVCAVFFAAQKVSAQTTAKTKEQDETSTGALAPADEALKDQPAENKEEGGGLGEILSSWVNALSEAIGEPTTLEPESAVVLGPEDILTAEEKASGRAWAAPDYGNQKALGYDPDSFAIPKGLEDRVAFWRDIYTKHTSDQGVLHDNLYINIVYGTVDFGAIMRDSSKTSGQKLKAREKLVQEKREEVLERLRRLQGATSANGLSGEDLRLWKLFEAIPNPDGTNSTSQHFAAATAKGRVRFQLGQRDRFITGIYHSGRYLREMERIFRNEGMPVELTRLPFVESSFNLRARSRVGASGIWQFMPRTAKPFMRVNRDIDERNDPLKSTRASARLLKQNYTMLLSWPLAVTGYNHGPYGVKTIAAKLGTKDLAEIIKRSSAKRFGFASENFYACFLAALDAERNAPKYFGEVRWGPEVEATELRVTRPLNYPTLLSFFDGDATFAELANPHLTSRIRKGRVNIPNGTFIRVPITRLTVAQDYLRTKMDTKKLAGLLRSNPINGPAIIPVKAEGKDAIPLIVPVSKPVSGEGN